MYMMAKLPKSTHLLDSSKTLHPCIANSAIPTSPTTQSTTHLQLPCTLKTLWPFLDYHSRGYQKKKIKGEKLATS